MTTHLGSPSYAASSRAHTNTSARSSFSLGSAPGPGTPAKITQEDIAYARMGGGGYPVVGVNGGVNGVSSPAESTAALLALQREQTLLAAAAAAATNNDGWTAPSDVSDTNPLMQGGGGGMGTHAGVTGYPAPVVDPSATQSMNPGGLQSMNPAADPFPRKGPSGPRRAGEGVEEEEQAVVAMEWLPNGGLQLCVTLLAAGFVIGSAGASVREITQHTGAVIQSWTQQRQPGGYHRPTRIFRLQGPRHSVAAASEIIHQAVERYKELCEGKRRGEFVQRLQRIRGVVFSYQPPPRSAAPQAAALGGVKGAGAAVGGAFGVPGMMGGGLGNVFGVNANGVNAMNGVDPVAAAAALLGSVPGRYPHAPSMNPHAMGTHYSQYTGGLYPTGITNPQMPRQMAQTIGEADGLDGGGGIDLGGFSLPAGTDPEIVAAAGAAAAAAAAQKKHQLLLLQQRRQMGGGVGSSVNIPAPRGGATKLSAAAPGFESESSDGGISFGTGASFDPGQLRLDRLSLGGGDLGGGDQGYFPHQYLPHR